MRAAEVLAENNRLGELDKISDTFDDIMAAVRGEVKATITTAEVRPKPCHSSNFRMRLDPHTRAHVVGWPPGVWPGTTALHRFLS